MNTWKPSEAQEQRTIIQWARIAQLQMPELALLVHIPNEGKRSPIAGRKLKEAGLRPGFPDLILFVARGQFHGLAIEVKTSTGKVKTEQEMWLERLADQGYRAVVCRGSEQAIDTILKYLRLRGSNDSSHHNGQGTGSITSPEGA